MFLNRVVHDVSVMRQGGPNTGPNAVPVVTVVNPGARATPAQSTAPTVPAGQAPPSRIAETLSSIPVATLAFLGINIALYLYTAFWTVELGDYAIGAYLVAIKLQFYRLITAALFHNGLLHIGMNMMSLYVMGASLERLFGSVQFFVFTWLFVVLGGALYVVVDLLLAYVVLRDIDW